MSNCTYLGAENDAFAIEIAEKLIAANKQLTARTQEPVSSITDVSTLRLALTQHDEVTQLIARLIERHVIKKTESYEQSLRKEIAGLIEKSIDAANRQTRK